MKDNQEELFTVVDKDDHILEYRTRYDCHHDISLTHRVTDIAIFNNKDELLLQKRSMQKDLFPGYYTLSAAGHVSKGEEYEEAAKRELEEELGVKNVPLQMVGKVIVETDFETEMVAVFIGKHNVPFQFAKDEIDIVNFFSQEEIKKIKNLTPVAKACLKILKIL